MAVGTLPHPEEKRGGYTITPLLVVPYRLVLIPMFEVMRVADLGVLNPWYADDVDMEFTARWESKLLRALMKKFPYHRYFLEPYTLTHL